MTILISFVLFFLVSIPVAAWVSTTLDVLDNGRKVVILEGGNAAIITMFAVILAYSAAVLIGTVRIGMGIYRMAHPEKYVDRALGKE